MWDLLKEISVYTEKNKNNFLSEISQIITKKPQVTHWINNEIVQ